MTSCGRLYARIRAGGNGFILEGAENARASKYPRDQVLGHANVDAGEQRVHVDHCLAAGDSSFAEIDFHLAEDGYRFGALEILVRRSSASRC